MRTRPALPVLILALLFAAGDFAVLAQPEHRAPAVGLFLLGLVRAFLGFALHQLERRIEQLEHHHQLRQHLEDQP